MQMTVNQNPIEIYQSEGSKMNENQSIKECLFSLIDANKNTPDALKNIEEILIEIKEQRESLEKEKLSMFYPKQSSKDEHTQEMGLTEENNAMLFLSTPQPSQSIKSKLINSIELNKIDFASTMFQKLLPQVPDNEKKWNELKNKNLYKFNLLLAVKVIYKNFVEQKGIGIINNELEILNELESKAIEFKQNLNKFELTIN